MNTATVLLVSKMIDIALTITTTLGNFGINYREVMDEQEAAEKEGREVNSKMFIDQAQDAIDKL